MALLIAAAVGIFMKLKKSENGTIQYETETVSIGNIETIVAATGVLQPFVAVEIGTQVSGRILKLHVQPGDVVEKGQLLVEIDASVHQATVDAGKAALEGASAQLAEEEAQELLARQQLTRHEQMARDGATREEDLQIAKAALTTASARIRLRHADIAERQSRLKADEAQLSFTKIYAPMGGTVVSLDAKEGQTINSTYQTQTVLRIADLTKMTVWTAVAEADIQKVKPGMPAYFTTLGSEEKWSGTVRQVLPMPPLAAGAKEEPAAANTKVVQYTVLFDVENRRNALMPKMTARVNIVTDSAKDVLVVPVAGLTPTEEDSKTFKARVIGVQGEVLQRSVRVGKRDLRQAEVIDGLQAGERVIVIEKEKEELRRFTW